MSSNYEMLRKDFYICMKCSVINPDLSVYESDEYKELIAKDLNTGVENFVFDNREMAESKLKQMGTSWNLCVINLPIKKIELDKASKTFHLKKTEDAITVESIEEITLHPILRQSHVAYRSN